MTSPTPRKKHSIGLIIGVILAIAGMAFCFKAASLSAPVIAAARASGTANGTLQGKAAGQDAAKAGDKNTNYAERDGETAGYKTGYAKGETAGEQAGYDKGYSNGEKVGQEAGYAMGLASGNATGEAETFQAGQADGLAAGYAQAKSGNVTSTSLVHNPTSQEVFDFFKTLPGEDDIFKRSGNIFEINNLFEKQGIRTGIAWLWFQGQYKNWPVLCFDTTDQGRVYIDFWARVQVFPVVGRTFSQAGPFYSQWANIVISNILIAW